VKELLADSFYYLALANAGDRRHARAVSASRDKSARHVTHAWVLAEVGDALASLGSRRLFTELLDLLHDDPTASVLPATQELFDRGAALYRARADKEWSLTDCISFVVMRDRGIQDALTGDRHYEQAGFKVLLK